MLKTQLLIKIDTCLKSYVNQNNSRYKRSINTIFMDRAQLRNFYHDMQGEKESEKMEQLEKNGEKPNSRKSKSCFIKGNKIVDWKNFDRVQMNQKALISNFSGAKYKRENSGIKKQSLKIKEYNPKVQASDENSSFKYNSEIPLMQVFQFFCPSEQICEYATEKMPFPNFNQNLASASSKQFDMQEIEMIRKEQQEKCINKYRLKLGKKQLKPSEEVQFEIAYGRSEIEKSRNQQKINHKLTVCFENFVEGMQNDLFREGNKEIDGIRKEIKRKDQISNAIRAYFIKNNRDFKLKSRNKENTLYQKFMQGKQQIRSEFKSHFSRKNKNILII